MLAFLRKIRRSLIESGSTRKYLLYAIGEIALIVIGILIALQINNWNEFRKERKKESVIIKSLNDELASNWNYFDDEINYLINRNEKSAKYLLDLIGSNPPNMHTDSLVHHVASVSIMAPFSPKSATFTRIINSDEFNLIQFDSLKSLLNQYDLILSQALHTYESVTNWGFGEVETERYMGGLNHAIQLGKSLGLSELSQLKKSKVYKVDPQSILSNPDFETTISWYFMRIRVTRMVLEIGQRHIKKVQDFIQRHYSL